MLQLIFLIFVFQSTLSVRRATVRFPRSFQFLSISIHALRKESDAIMATPGFTDSIFQSTLSVRRATSVWRFGMKDGVISIHALRKESDP